MLVGYRWPHDATLGLCGQPAHPQADRGVLRLDEDGRRPGTNQIPRPGRSMPSFPSGWSPTTCDHTAPRSETLGSSAGISAGDGRTIERRIRISRRCGGSARCSRSRVRVRRRNFSPRTPRSTTPLTSNVISPRPKRTARFAPRRWTLGAAWSQRPDRSWGADTARSLPAT